MELWWQVNVQCLKSLHLLGGLNIPWVAINKPTLWQWHTVAFKEIMRMWQQKGTPWVSWELWKNRKICWPCLVLNLQVQNKPMIMLKASTNHQCGCNISVEVRKNSAQRLHCNKKIFENIKNKTHRLQILICRLYYECQNFLSIT